MATRLEPLNLVDYTGGLNLRANQFQLAENESPELANITIDPLGGIFSRRGWERWTTTTDVDFPVDPEDWDPRRAHLSQLADGTDLIHVAAGNTIWATDGAFEFTDAEIPCSADSHLADFATFGDTVYIACGWSLSSWSRVGVAAPAAVTSLSTGNFNNDYTTPVGGIFPRAELVEAHAGYAFVAYTGEAGVAHPNRIRWSHPTSQGDWAELDFLDINIGGSHITALMSYEDHLLIFKPDSVWALYGYNSDSWQLVQKSSTIGARGPQGVTRNEQVVFFYSASDIGGIYYYSGERPEEISMQLRRAFTSLIQPELVWVGWAARKLWVTVPWNYDGPTVDNASVFVFDPTVGEGAWTYYTSGVGALGPLVAGSNIDSQARPLGVLRDTTHPCIVALESRPEAADDLLTGTAVLGASVGGGSTVAIVTDDGDMILADGTSGTVPFETYYRTPWLTAGWPTRKKSWRRPDFVCRRTDTDHRLHVQSFRDYEEVNVRRQSIVEVLGSGGAGTVWGDFDWGDGSEWGTGAVAGATIRRGGSFGMCRALQLRISSLTPGARWGIDAIVTKYVMRRFR
jgi:hypothetical protein